MCADRVIVAALLAALLVGCGEPVCVRNSDCAAPLACSASGVCGGDQADAAIPDAVDATDATDATDALGGDALVPDAPARSDETLGDAGAGVPPVLDEFHVDGGSLEVLDDPGGGVPPVLTDRLADAGPNPDAP